MVRPFFVIFIGIVSGEILINLTGVRFIMFPVILAGICAFFAAKYFFWHSILFYGAFLFGILLFLLTSLEGSFESILKNQNEEGYITGKVTQIRKSGEDRLNITIKDAEFLSGENLWVLKKKCIIFLEEDWEVFPGDQIKVKGSITLPEEATNPGQFDAKNYYRASGIFYLIYGEKLISIDRPSFSIVRLACMLKIKIHQVYDFSLTKMQSALLYAMVLGDKSELSDEMKKLFEESGTAHLLAVSGLHISIVGGRIYRFLRRRKCSYFLSCLGGSLVLLFYGCITGYGSSVTRAILMFLVFLGAEYLGVYYDILSSMSFSGILMLVEHPYRILEGGFLISYASILAIGTVVPVVEKGIEKKKRKSKSEFGNLEKIIKQCIMGSMITVTIIPIMMRIFFEFSPYSILLNLIMIPSMTLLMIFAIGGGLIGTMIPCVGFVLLIPVRFILILFEKILLIVDRFPGSPIITGCPKMIFIIIFYLLEVIILYLWYHNKQSVLAIVFLAVFTCYLFLPEDRVKVTMFDVGQGDGILLSLPDHTSFLIDGGSSSESGVGEYIIEPALKYYGIGTLDYAVITHLDQDHYSGVLTLMEQGFKIKHLLLQDWNLKSSGGEAYKQIISLARENHTVISYVGKGDSIRFSGGEISCLHPYTDLNTGDKNDASIVLLFQYRSFSMLFTGDLGQEQEENVLGSCKEKKIDILKVGHHGSKNSTSDAFLCGLNPVYGVISAGKNNRYGHPHKELLERLKNHGVEVFRTDLGGAICIMTDGDKQTINYWR